MTAKLRDRVRDVIDHVVALPPEATTDSFELSGLGADSLDMVEVVSELEEEFDISIPDADVQKWTTIADVIGTVDGLTG